MDEDWDQDPISSVLTTRRIPHGRSGRSSGRQKGNSKSIFNPMRAIGEYEVEKGSGGKAGSSDDACGIKSRFTIHELTSNQNGLVASFEIDGILGMAILSGSRKSLASAINDIEDPVAESENGANDDELYQQSMRSDVDTDNKLEDVQYDPDEDSTTTTGLELEDELINQRTKAFEKNTFRNPKFWLQWKGHVNGQSGSSDETNKGYLIFSGNDCSKFEGTISSKLKGWDNVKLKGYKVKSHAGANLFEWSDFEPSEEHGPF